jgi:arylsulfatase A-like enzyme
VIAGCLRTAIFVAAPGSAWHSQELTRFDRIGLLCYGLLVACAPAFVCAACFAAAPALARRSPAAGAGARWAARGVVFAIEAFLFASWNAFHSTGQFLAADAWTLAVASPSLLLASVRQTEPLALAAVPVAAAVVTALLEVCCLRAERSTAGGVRGLIRLAGAAFALALVLAWRADVTTGFDTQLISLGVGRPRWPVHQVYELFAQEKTEPLARLLSDVLAKVVPPGSPLAARADARSAGAPMVSLGDYARGVDSQAVRRWNVVIVIVESMRADVLLANGGRRVVMPTVEALAREGTLYTHAIAPAAQTDYATTSVLSSQYPLRTAKYRVFPLRPEYPRVLLYDILKQFGWRTAVFSSQNEHWGRMYNFLQTGGIEHFLHAETWHGPTYVPPLDSGFIDWMHATGRAGKIDDRHTIDEAIAWTDSIVPSAPFFAYINLQSSHTPYRQSPGFAPRFGTGRVSFPILFNSYPPDSAAAVRDMYDNSLAYADSQLARLVGALKRSGRWASTVVVVLGDHGEAFYEHGFAGHASELYREVTNIPLVIRPPSAQAVRDTLPASGLDVPPTVLSILGLPAHPAFQGVDLASEAVRMHRPVFSVSQTPLADEIAVTQDSWKLVFELRQKETRLFDLQHDPGETRDVDELHPVQLSALMGTLATWWTRQLAYYRDLRGDPKFYAPPSPRPAALDAPR